jgi:hypothetical protein
MALNEHRRLAQDDIQADRTALLAIRELREYSPHNPAISTETLISLEAALLRAQQEELRLRNNLDAARDTTTAAAWSLHNAILGAKAQVIAQYGYNSNAVQSLGLKKKSERRRPVRRSAATAAAARDGVEA